MDHSLRRGEVRSNSTAFSPTASRAGRSAINPAGLLERRLSGNSIKYRASLLEDFRSAEKPSDVASRLDRSPCRRCLLGRRTGRSPHGAQLDQRLGEQQRDRPAVVRSVD